LCICKNNKCHRVWIFYIFTFIFKRTQMLADKTIAVVIPAYNEESQLGDVIETMPSFVDRIIVVNDLSRDKTGEVAESYLGRSEDKSEIEIHPFHPGEEKRKYSRARLMLHQRDEEEKKFFTPSRIVCSVPGKSRIIVIHHLENGGVGAAIASGYKWCKDHHIDCTAVMAGDGQMDPDELISICEPVVKENIDYVKGNRLIHRSASMAIPKTRFIGNSILSILTKIASGYWHVSDTQTGYTAISLKALQSFSLYKIYKRYGMPNDMLVKLNIAFCTIREVEIQPIYFVGENSKMKIHKVIPKISWLLFKSFFKRLWHKYLFKDFHPLFILYHVAFLLFAASIPYAVKILKIVLEGENANPITLLVFIFLLISSLQSLLFAMWMDIQDNERLYK
jgi:glycosyltransferase involved in cell wall biosynthesis